jgi:hypothetical protein
MDKLLTDWMIEEKLKRGYLFCSECSNDNWEVYVNPNHLCDHLKSSMTTVEIETAIKKYDELNDYEEGESE